MNWTELLIAIVSHVSWPITIISLAWMFRDALQSLLGRLETANSKYVKVTLRSQERYEKLSRAEGIADALELPPPRDSSLATKIETDEWKWLRQTNALVKKQPSAALFGAWDELMQRIGSAIQQEVGRQPAPDQILPEAAAFLDKGIVGLMALLLMIVEQQKSNPSEIVDKDFVSRFIKLVTRVMLSVSRVEQAKANGDAQ